MPCRRVYRGDGTGATPPNSYGGALRAKLHVRCNAPAPEAPERRRSEENDMPNEDAAIKALTFDVFGTVVDWHGSVAREVRALAAAKGLRVNAVKFTKAWRAGYRPAMDRVRSGELPWTKIDVL